MISSTSELTAFEREVASRFGLVPNFFCSAPDAPEIVEKLWDFANSAYFDNPIPSVLKERLFVYVPLILICVRYTDTAGKLIGATGENYMARIDSADPNGRLPMDPNVKSLPEKQIGFSMDRRSAQ